MSRPNDDLEARLRGLREPDLPADLKGRVLAAVELAPVVTWRDRVWFSTRWRVAAAALLLALLSADRWVMPPRPAGSPDNDAATAADLQALEAVGAEIGMPAGMMRRLGERGGFSQHAVRGTIDETLATLGGAK
jgi:hypothetical protein